MWYLCLYAKQGIDLRQPLRSGASLEEMTALLKSVWRERRDRGAEVRKELEQTGTRGRLIGIEKLREDPHLEMHARGG
jgi:cyclic pyranopterin phosphate synthase